ncbi:YrzI family small protein [Bacillus sp. AK031]
MTLNILFMSITVRKRMRSSEDYNHDLVVSKHFEENRLKQESMRLF